MAAREANLAATQEALAAQQGAAQVEVSRLEASVRSLNKQLGEAEADYITGSERLTQLRREVSVGGGRVGVERRAGEEGRAQGTGQESLATCPTPSVPVVKV